MTLYRSNVILHSVNGLPEHDVINTFHFEDAGDTDVATAGHALNGVLAAAYGTAVGTVGAGDVISNYISPSISRTVKPTLKTYSIDKDTGLATSEPIEDTMAAFGGSAGTGALPREVACCLSYHGNLAGLPEEVADTADAGTERDRPASRHRGRVYIGPLSNNAGGGTPDYRPTLAFRNTLLSLAEYLLSEPTPMSSNELVWVVYSRKLRVTTDVTGAWVDDEFDTQRRRGLRRTSRATVGSGLA